MISEVSQAQKQTPTETYDAVLALYMVLRGTPGALKVRRAQYRDEVEALPLDYVLDVEIKTKRTAGPYYGMWQRLANAEHPELLPPWLKEELGHTYTEWGLSEEGAYRKLFFKVKNDQMRRVSKGKLNGDGFVTTERD
jgi:hypothetical protein